MRAAARRSPSRARSTGLRRRSGIAPPAARALRADPGALSPRAPCRAAGRGRIHRAAPISLINTSVTPAAVRHGRRGPARAAWTPRHALQIENGPTGSPPPSSAGAFQKRQRGPFPVTSACRHLMGCKKQARFGERRAVLLHASLDRGAQHALLGDSGGPTPGGNKNKNTEIQKQF